MDNYDDFFQVQQPTMAYYPQFPAYYGYAPLPYPAHGAPVPHPGQPEYYAVYPPGSSPPQGANPAAAGGPAPGQTMMPHHAHYEGGMMPTQGHKASYGSPFKPGYNNRKISSDSGISDFSGVSSR